MDDDFPETLVVVGCRPPVLPAERGHTPRHRAGHKMLHQSSLLRLAKAALPHALQYNTFQALAGTAPYVFINLIVIN